MNLMIERMEKFVNKSENFRDEADCKAGFTGKTTAADKTTEIFQGRL
jgi:hypothetical protein